MFTSMESILIHDWRLMGRTSLLMFPIYGCGAILAPIGSFADRWIGDGPLSRADWIYPAWPALYGTHLHGRVSVRGIFARSWVCVPGIIPVIRPV
ncbi:MAG: hypothetical protein ACLUD2_09070 [Clostridium sp.]